VRDLDVTLAQAPPEPWASRLRERSGDARAGLLKTLDNPGADRRLRYAVEWTSGDAEPIQELQDALGQVCDRVVALRHLEHGAPAGYRHELEHSQRGRLRHAHKVWRRSRPIPRELGRS
jgi:hypothetical protein